jgi:hypothetical protein
MSAKKITSGSFGQEVTIEARATRLSLSEDAVVIHKGGIEFRSHTSFSPWTEMTVTLQSPRDARRVNCSGVVISCAGNKHAGYLVSMIFTSLSKQAQLRLSTLAQATSLS